MRTVIGETVEFGAAGNSADHILYGWSAAEPTHTWTVGPESAIVLDAPESASAFFLEISWFPFTVPPYLAAQPVTIRVNNMRVFSGDVRAQEIVAVRCPPAGGARRVVIVFEHPEAARPADFGAGDTRELAIAFSRARLLPIVGPPGETVRPGAGERESRERLTGTTTADLTTEAERLAGVTLPELLTGFEMLAGNCDMGVAQRAFGLEPLSLLRFAGSYPAVSIKGLDTAFQGIGEVLQPWRGGLEWMMRDDYGLNYHTGQLAADVSEERLVEMERKRIAFLRRKFLDDLAAGEKIFVADRNATTLASIMPLYLALRRHGPRQLLWVVPAPDNNGGGLVREVLPGLFMAQLYQFRAPMVEHVSVPGWLEVLVNTWLLVGRPAVEGRAVEGRAA